MIQRALIYGTIAIDTLITPQGKASSVLGGSGIYAALAARLVSDRFDLIGVVGDDFPPIFTEKMEKAGVAMDHVSRERGETFAWTGEYQHDMNDRRTLRTAEGVQARWELRLPSALESHELMVATNVTPPLQYRFLEQNPRCLFSMADFMESWIVRERNYVDKLLARVDLALMNDREAIVYTHAETPIEAGYRLLNAGPRYAVVKHGSFGSTLFHRCADGSVRLFRCPAWPLARPVDPTGAGDSFMGALAAHLVDKVSGGSPAWSDLTNGIALATVVASITCESFGVDALLSATPKDVRFRLQEFRGMTAWG